MILNVPICSWNFTVNCRFTALVILLSHCKFLIPNLGFLELKFETNFFIGSMDLRTKIIEVFAVLILIAESAWVLFSLQHKLNLPTVQSRAMHLLIQFALETEEQKQEILLQAEKERIYFWPGNGMPIVSELSLAERLDRVLGQIIPQIKLSLNVNFLSSLSLFELKTKHVDVTRLLKLMGHVDRFEQHSFSDVDMDLTGAFEGQSLSVLSGEMSSSHGFLSLGKATSH